MRKLGPCTASLLLVWMLSACGPKIPPWLDRSDVLRAPESEGGEKPQNGRREPVRFEASPESDRSDLSAYAKTGSEMVRYGTFTVEREMFIPICRLPCAAPLRPRTYQLSFAAGDHDPVNAQRRVRLRGGELVRVDYDQRVALRALGWVVLIGGVGGGMGLVASGLPNEGHVETAQVVSGSIITALSLVGGLIMVNQRDRVSVELTHP